MKKAIIYSILFLSLSLFFSCSSDDDNVPNNSNFDELIIGQWKRTALTVDGATSQSHCATDFKVTFGPDEHYGESPFDGSSCTSTGNTGTYTITGSELIIMSGFFSRVAEITTLNESTFQYSYTNLSNESIKHTYSKL